MSKAIDNLQAAMKKAMANRPAVGGFPYLAETLRAAGVKTNEWTLPSCQSLYITDLGPVVVPGLPLETGIADVPVFNQLAVIHALREDQTGRTSFPKFLAAIWQAGIVRYSVDFTARQVTYFGCHGESYVEAYPDVAVR
ncbi:DUF1398 family protein [Buttiauxella selenatireducens]|uniref:DUF1398 family protein n=1 Tax=Buttiauxella selenatireducens TaxID=3073902 RepID=A0ABY9S5V6_9ENTR|nr:DUF1398 family protein [Buttiauxella sp. R73]WMY72506.1 DUF1398 family protein [Buttiauxella sp. R73]